MDFINREEELHFLKEKWLQDEPQLIVVYGKRRVGKTELTIRFSKDKPHFYFLCERIPLRNQLKKFTESIGNYFQDEFLPPDGFKDWETLLKYIAGKNQKLVITIDEFSYLIETDPAIPSSFQKAWDLYLKNSNVFLILTGSSISMMERSVLFYKAPLYGRRTGQILVRPFRFRELKKMFPEKDFDEILSIYSMVGGTALYLNKFKNKPYLQVVRDEILKKGEPLYEEVEFLLREELKEPRNYFVILEAISLGKHRLSEIINETGFDKGTVSRYISILNDIQITKKEIPITEKIPEKSRKGIYVIEDNFVNAWFRFVFRNRSLLEENRTKEVLSKIEASMGELLSKNYEKIAGELLFETIATGRIKLRFDTFGRWWDKDAEMDLVAINSATNEILFGEVKWSNKKIGVNIYNELKEKAGTVTWGKKGRKEYFALFSKSGFTPDMLALAKKENILLFQKNNFLGNRQPK
jgi:Predicted ATPase (AAA+ superfamily)